MGLGKKEEEEEGPLFLAQKTLSLCPSIRAQFLALPFILNRRDMIHHLSKQKSRASIRRTIDFFHPSDPCLFSAMAFAPPSSNLQPISEKSEVFALTAAAFWTSVVLNVSVQGQPNSVV